MLAKKATLTANAMIRFVSHWSTGRLTSVVFGAIPCRRIVR